MSTLGKRIRNVWAPITAKNGAVVRLAMGRAVVGADGSITVYLDSLPVGGKIVIDPAGVQS